MEKGKYVQINTQNSTLDMFKFTDDVKTPTKEGEIIK